MSIARRVAPELPTLRRFARLVAGSQASGDAHVIATLEALTADPTILAPELPARQALYKTFLKLWSSADSHRRLDSLDRGPGIAAEHNLRAITPLPRQAFLLRAVEGLSIAEVAAILDKSPDTVNELISQAGREIAEQVATEVLIIEDEPIIALDIEATMQELGHNVIAIARTHKEAIESVRKRRPGIVLADILLADGSSGLAAVNGILCIDKRAGDLHHGLSGAPFNRRKTGAHLRYHQTLPHRDCQRDRQSGVVFRSLGRARSLNAR